MWWLGAFSFIGLGILISSNPAQWISLAGARWVALLGLTMLGFIGCSGVDPPAGKGFHTAIIGKMDPHPNEDEDVVAANRNWYQMID